MIFWPNQFLDGTWLRIAHFAVLNTRRIFQVFTLPTLFHMKHCFYVVSHGFHFVRYRPKVVLKAWSALCAAIRLSRIRGFPQFDSVAVTRSDELSLLSTMHGI